MILKKGTPEHQAFLEKLGQTDIYFTDSHAHIHSLDDEQSSLVFKKMKEHKVMRVLTVGTDISDSQKAVEFAQTHENVYASVGVHPHEAELFEDNGIDTLRKLFNQPNVVAVGEIGLDFFYDHSPRKVQEQVFSKLLLLAKEMEAPIIIHNRESTERLIDILRSELPPRDRSGIIHCFSGDKDLLRFGLDNGFYISYSGVVSFPKSSELRETIKYVPRERLLIETDAPYLTPVPYRGKINEPAYVVYTALVMAEQVGISLEKMAKILENNFQTLFGGRL